MVPFGVCFCCDAETFASAGEWQPSLVVSSGWTGVTSSGFGWRLQPLLGSWLVHSGRDFAAPEDASVVAALFGTVLSSGLEVHVDP